MARRKVIAELFYCGLPDRTAADVAELFPIHPRWKRFLDRGEPIDEKLVHSFATAEQSNVKGRVVSQERL